MRTLLIAIVCLLVSGGSAAAQSKPAPAPTPPPAANPPPAAAPAPAPAPKRTVELVSMGSSMDGDDLSAQFKFGLACVPDRSARLRGVSSRFSDERFQEAFRDAMESEGFRVSSRPGRRDMFNSVGGGAADLQVGATIRSLRLETCTRSDRRDANAEGSARMEVAWEVNSSQEGKVLTKIVTYGSYSTDASADRIIERLLDGAFKRAAQQFGDDPLLARIVKTGLTTVERTVPLTPLTITVPGPQSTAIARAGAAVVSIVVADGHGSGVLVSPEGYILTNRHVAGDSGKVRVVWADGSESLGQVLRANRKRDVALVKVEAPKAQPLSIRHDQPQLAETVFAIGTPLEKELAGTLTRGIVSGLRINDGQPFIQSDVVINHGNSGGPLLDEKGQVIGLAVMGFLPGGAQAGINFFIPIDAALKGLELTPRTIAAAAPARPAARPAARRAGKVTSKR